MCDVNLPRSEGTCTRCPFQITTTAAPNGSQAWTCRITLQHRYGYRPGHESNESGFDGWAPHAQPEICNFATVNSKAELELVLRRAQVAILNPTGINWLRCTSMSAAEVDGASHEVDFSPNVIGLEIMAPGLLDLSFYDLPGAINSLPEQQDDNSDLPGFIEVSNEHSTTYRETIY